ncbi:alpha/beta fold hydrolase [Flavobacterium sp.]|uniref:alpha/beta fold hydrolase n=1 Tax=Flavobacterium sp. TaxID=239 RepID=UPI0039E2E6AD
MKTKNIKIIGIVLALAAGTGESQAQGSAAAQTQFAETSGRKIAFRSFGKGNPIVLVNRFRGTMDSWDPLFLDELARHHRIIIFDYTGIGESTGTLPTDIVAVAKDVKDLCDFLQLKKTAVLGWSYGGFVTQAALFQYPDLVTHAILVGTNPPGANPHDLEPIFLERALIPVNNFDDFTVLFFEPKSEVSKAAAKRSYDRIAKRFDVSKVPAKQEIFDLYFQGGATFKTDAYHWRDQLKKTQKPVLAVCGDHDICFPVENWYALARELPSTQLIVFPHSGHGPQHQFPELTAQYITNFLQLTH